MNDHVSPRLDDAEIAAYAAARHSAVQRSRPHILLASPHDIARAAADIAGHYFRRQPGDATRTPVSQATTGAYIANAFSHYGADFEELAELSNTIVVNIVVSVSPDMTMPATRRHVSLASKVSAACPIGKVIRLAAVLESIRVLEHDPSPHLRDPNELAYWCSDQLRVLAACRPLACVDRVADLVRDAVDSLERHASFAASAPGNKPISKTFHGIKKGFHDATDRFRLAPVSL